MRPKKQAADTLIEGVLIPVRWTATGEVSEASLMTFDEDEYRIDMAAAEAHNLRDCLRKHIRIVGRTRGNRVVRVTAVEFLESQAPMPSRHPEPGRES